MSVIETTDLTKWFGDTTAVNGIDLNVEEGQLYGFIGPNGAGKTTTIEMLTGQQTPDSGTISVMGHDPTDEPKTVRSKVGILPEREDPPSFLTPREYFEFITDVRGIGGIEDRTTEWADRLKFADRLDTLSRDLSKGERQKVMIAQAFLHEPELVFIDEPLINLDPIIQERVKDFFVDYSEAGNTIFLSTHVMSLAEDICTHIGIIDDGTLFVQDELSAVMADAETLTDAFVTRVSDFEAAAPDA